MSKRLKVFAKFGTDEKAIVSCFGKEDIIKAKENLIITYGGSWVLVDTIDSDEHIIFKDRLEYKGFAKQERYINGVSKFKW